MYEMLRHVFGGVVEDRCTVLRPQKQDGRIGWHVVDRMFSANLASSILLINASKLSNDHQETPWNRTNETDDFSFERLFDQTSSSGGRMRLCCARVVRTLYSTVPPSLNRPRAGSSDLLHTHYWQSSSRIMLDLESKERSGSPRLNWVDIKIYWISRYWDYAKYYRGSEISSLSTRVRQAWRGTIKLDQETVAVVYRALEQLLYIGMWVSIC